MSRGAMPEPIPRPLSPVQKQQVNQVFKEAVRAGSIEGGLQRVRHGLDAQTVAVLKSLTPDDLRVIARVQEKLKGLGGPGGPVELTPIQMP